MEISFRQTSLKDGEKELFFLQSLESENINGFQMKIPKNMKEFEKLLNKFIKDSENPDFGRVPQKVYWIEINEKIIGIVKIRETLNENLKKIGGNIGYFVGKDYRNKGYGKKILKNALALFRNHKYIIITCAESNIPSQKVIEDNGGKLIETNNGHCVYKINL